MKKLTDRLLRLATLMVLLIGAAQANQDAQHMLIDRIIAVVGDDVVMLSELRNESLKLAQGLRQRGVAPMPSSAAIQKQAFDTLVMNKLQLAEAARLGIQADEETLARAVRSIADNNRLTEQELRETLEAEGMDFELFLRSMRDEIIVRRLRNREITNRIEVTKSEIDSYLERSGSLDGRTAVRLLYIMIPAPEDANSAAREEARIKATEVAQQLREGADFRTLAQQVSEGQNALQGGDLDWMDMHSIPPLFQPYVAKMIRGQTEGPIAAGRGFHIIQLDDIRYGASHVIQQTQARHILIRTNEVTSDEDAQRRLEQLRARIVNGDDFATLARSNSDDTATAISGGDLGWSSPGNLVPAFEEQMDLLAIGEVSQPFKTQFGWHLVQVIGRRDHDATDESLRDQARQAVRDAKAEEALEAYLRRLRDEAYIELRFED